MSGIAVGTAVVSIGVGLYEKDKAKKDVKKRTEQEAQLGTETEAINTVIALMAEKHTQSQNIANKIVADTQIFVQKQKVNRIVIASSLIGGAVLVGLTTIVLTIKKLKK